MMPTTLGKGNKKQIIFVIYFQAEKQAFFQTVGHILCANCFALPRFCSVRNNICQPECNGNGKFLANKSLLFFCLNKKRIYLKNHCSVNCSSSTLFQGWQCSSSISPARQTEMKYSKCQFFCCLSLYC